MTFDEWYNKNVFELMKEEHPKDIAEQAWQAAHAQGRAEGAAVVEAVRDLLDDVPDNFLVPGDVTSVSDENLITLRDLILKL